MIQSLDISLEQLNFSGEFQTRKGTTRYQLRTRLKLVNFSSSVLECGGQLWP